MRNKQTIIFTLLTAYLLMFAHGVIPHHHHNSLSEAEHHHQHEHSAHNHGHKHTEGHGHTGHFVHSADFDTYIGSNQLQVSGAQPLYFDNLFDVLAQFDFSLESIQTEKNWFQDLPPPYKGYHPIVLSLRGPPSFIS